MEYDKRIGRYGCHYHNGYWECVFDGEKYTYTKAPNGLTSHAGYSREAPNGMIRSTWQYIDVSDLDAETDW